MCEPTTLLLIASAASAVVGYVQTSNANAAQSEAIQANSKAQAEQTKVQYDQINQNAQDKMSARAREAMIEQGKLRTISGETGLTGVSTDRIQAESQFNLGTDLATINQNRANTLNQAAAGANSNLAKSQSQMNSITRPSLIGTGLQIAGAYGTYAGEQQRLARIGTAVKTDFSQPGD